MTQPADQVPQVKYSHIYLSASQALNVDDPLDFRKCVAERIELFPELFPPEIAKGYLMKDIYYSKKLSIPIRRIEIVGTLILFVPAGCCG